MAKKKQRMTKEELSRVPASEGYLIVDSNKCSGCQTCMIACSLAHEGVENIKLSRIQVLYDPWGHYPHNIRIKQCRQCAVPECMAVCPIEGAFYADPDNGNVRTIDLSKCTGCWLCVKACPYTPSRIAWDFENKLALKCDLCANTPHWNEEGGADGEQACVSLCPMQAIKFVKEQPSQIADEGYDVNLRREDWRLDKSCTAGQCESEAGIRKETEK